MRTGIDVTQRFEYSFPDDVDPKTVYVIKPLTASERFDMGQYVTVGADGKPTMKLTGEVALNSFLVVIDEIRNFSIKKSDGVETIALAKDRADIKRIFASMDSNDIALIFQEALRVSTLTKGLAKNS